MTVLADERQPALSLDAGSTEPIRAVAGFAGRPAGLAVAPDGALFVSDSASRTIWHLRSGGPAVAVVAEPIDSFAGSPGRRMLTPAGLALAPDGTLFVADRTGHRIWAIAPGGGLRVVAGSVYGYRDGPGEEALFRFPADVALASDGTLFVADSGSDRIRTISPEGLVATLAGSIYDYGDGRGPAARFRRPAALDVDAQGSCYVADTGNNAVRRITPDGEVTTLAGSPPGGDSDGVGEDVGLRWPSGLAVGRDGCLFVADYGNGALRRIDPAGASTTCLRLSGRRWPAAVALRPDGEVLVAAVGLDDVRRPRACFFPVESTRASVDVQRKEKEAA